MSSAKNMENKPFFSVILPVFNREKTIARAIESVLEQTLINWELWVIDDGSTDKSAAIIQQFNDSRIHYVYQENAERSAARNRGIELSKAEYICFLDSDDYYLPEHLQTLFDVISKNENAPNILYTESYSETNEKRTLQKQQKAENAQLYVWKYFFWMNSVCIQRDLFKNNKFPEQFSIWEDTHLWLRITRNENVEFISKATNVMVVHKDQSVLTERNFNIAKAIEYVHCMKDLFQNYSLELVPNISIEMQREYLESKLNMLIYQASENKLFKGSFLLYKYLLQNNFGFKNLLFGIRLLLKLLFKKSMKKSK